MSAVPVDFLWGSATAAHQVEGGGTNRLRLSDGRVLEPTPAA